MLSSSRPSAAGKSEWYQSVWICLEILLLTGLLAYSNSFSGAFIHDDLGSIRDNSTIRHFWSGEWLFPPHQGETVGGRPMLNFTFALNYAFGGLRPQGYHTGNLLIHLLASLALFGIVHRTLLGPLLRPTFESHAVPLAAAVAGLWMIHPLQTNDVTYIVQRAESLMGLFYFLTLYAFIQATTCPRPSLWYAASIFACFCGMATKEVMVTAPLMVFLYDRTFVAGSLKGAWAARRYYYIGLLSTWLLLAYLIAGAGTREGTVGTSIYTPWSSYVLMQPVALVQYLALSVWPSPLIFDYGSHVMHNSWILAGATSLIFLLASGIAYAIWRRPVLGFLGAWFLIILAPTSSILVVSPETISEHRMYLPLAAITAFLVLGLYALAPRLSWSLIVVSALVLGFLTYQRNWVYRDEYTVWMDTVTKVPDNLTAVTGLGNALIDRGQPAEAIPVLEQAIHASPSSPPAYTDLGIALFQLGRIPEAMTYFRDALNLKSTDAYTHFNYGLALDRTGHISEAIEQYREALQQKPTLEAARENLRRLLSKK